MGAKGSVIVEAGLNAIIGEEVEITKNIVCLSRMRHTHAG